MEKMLMENKFFSIQGYFQVTSNLRQTLDEINFAHNCYT